MPQPVSLAGNSLACQAPVRFGQSATSLLHIARCVWGPRVIGGKRYEEWLGMDTPVCHRAPPCEWPR
jgi:hypothetical protein